jgi:hypothetical protein
LKLIVSAFYKEVSFLIKHYNLKKENAPFELFKNDELIVIISGTTKINSAIATTYALTKYPVKFAINFGLAGGKIHKRDVGDIFLINKIDRCLYPDILIKHPFQESAITCSEHVVTSGEFDLVDMESEGFFKSATKFLPLENIFLIKVVSDNFVCFLPDDKFLNILFEPHIENIVSFIDSLQNEEKKLFNENYLNNLVKKYNLSFSQKEILKNRIIYYNLNNFKLPNIDFEPKNRKYNFNKILEYFEIKE